MDYALIVSGIAWLLFLAFCRLVYREVRHGNA